MPKEKEYELKTIIEDYIPEVCAFQVKESDEESFGFYIQYLGKNSVSKKNEAALIYSQKVYPSMDEAILSGLDVLEILGYELDENKPMKFLVQLIDPKTKKFYDAVFLYDGDKFIEDVE